MVTNTTTTTNSARPSIHFDRDEDTHARDQSAQSVTDIPLTKVATTESTKSRRSIFSVIADRFCSGSRSSSNSRSRSRSHSKDTHRKSLNTDRVTSNGSGARRSSTEIERRDRNKSSGSDYVDVIRAQALFMEKLKEGQHYS
ncbi:hypothetical protein BGX21_005153 [Mortierella sp. AD011]|nr:hypothetical protein BGX20_006344 [Mortierella sp. AD010]KAF9400019.1 hypothetical protein BGX21_005153 [Mortierella sp. AD011]